VTIRRGMESLYTDVMGESTKRAAAPRSNERLHRLLERIALVTRPGGGGALVLFALGRIASSSRWLGGDGFSAEITGDEVDSKLEIYVECERVVPATRFGVPVAELIATFDADPELVGSLRVAVAPRRLLLTNMRASGEVRIT
jgi:hypothetical protein